MNKNFDKEKAKKRLAFVPFGLFILFALAFFAVGVTAFIYSIVTYLAFESAIIFLIIFGSFALSIGIGLLLIDSFVAYKKKYDEKYKQLRHDDEAHAPASTKIVETKKFKLKFQTVCYCIMVVGAILVLTSAGLALKESDSWEYEETPNENDSTSDEDWQDILGKSLGRFAVIAPRIWQTEKGEFLVEHGYNSSAKLYELVYYKPIDKITLDLKGKNVIVKYTNDDFVMIRGHEKFSGQLMSIYVNGTLKITENPAPSIEGDTVAEMLGFLFEDSEAEAQIWLYIPLSQKDNIEIIGDYVIAQE